MIAEPLTPPDDEADAARSLAVAGAFAMGIIGPLLASIPSAIPLLVARGRGAAPDSLWQAMARPEAIAVSLVLGALGTVLVVAIPRRFRWREMAERYAIRWPPLDFKTYALMVAGSMLLILGSGSLGSALVKLHVLPDFALSKALLGLVQAMEHAPWPLFFAIGLAHALGPGITEELMFRGHVQRGLRARFSPLAAIATTSALFAAWHGHPVRIVLAFGGGCWLGWIAWRCDATGPGMIVHALTNFLYFTGSTGYRRLRHTPMATHDRWPLTQSLLVFVTCALLTVWIARLLTKRLPDAPELREGPASSDPPPAMPAERLS